VTNVILFFNECAYTNGMWLGPDKDSVTQALQFIRSSCERKWLGAANVVLPT
jgi:hypothetical protein